MDYKLKAKKLGNNWYLDIDHVDPNDIYLGEKISRVLNILDKNKCGIVEINLIESHSFLYDNAVWIDDRDLLKYFTTDYSIPIHFTVYDIEFSISSELYSLLEFDYNFNFHKTTYNLEIYNWTI